MRRYAAFCGEVTCSQSEKRIQNGGHQGGLEANPPPKRSRAALQLLKWLVVDGFQASAFQSPVGRGCARTKHMAGNGRVPHA